MPRLRRIKNKFGVYLISQYSAKNQVLFESEEDKVVFLSALDRSRKKNGFFLYGVLLKKHAFELLIDTNGKDVSKLMKEIEISYAMHRRCEDCLYRDRFKSELIKSKQRFNILLRRMSIEEGIDLDDAMILLQNCNDKLERHCVDCISSREEAEVFLTIYAKNASLTREEILHNKIKRNQAIVTLRRESNLSLRQIGELFGGLSESSICKILNQAIKERNDYGL